MINNLIKKMMSLQNPKLRYHRIKLAKNLTHLIPSIMSINRDFLPGGKSTKTRVSDKCRARLIYLQFVISDRKTVFRDIGGMRKNSKITCCASKVTSNVDDDGEGGKVGPLRCLYFAGKKKNGGGWFIGGNFPVLVELIERVVVVLIDGWKMFNGGFGWGFSLSNNTG